MKKVLKLKEVLLLVVLSLTLVACGTKVNQDKGNTPTPAPTNNENIDGSKEEIPPTNRPTVDRVGNEITIPETVNKIVSLAPSTSIVLHDLGVMDKVIAVDTNTPFNMTAEGIAWDGIIQFDMMAPDLEQILALEPDIVFTSTMSNAGGEDIFLSLRNAGICVAEIPNSVSIKDIKTDLQFIGDCVDKSEEAATLVEGMERAISEIEAIGKTIEEKKTVIFEVSAAPFIYSFGQGVFLHEMIELIGATNALGNENGWISVTEEAAVLTNPDVILTNINYIEDPIGEILSREGFKEVTAIANKEVYFIDNSSSSLPNHKIIKALKEMAKAVYPEAYGALEE